METYFWLVCLQQILKQFTHTDNSLRMRGDSLQVTQVFGVKSTENEVDFFLLVRNVAKWSKIRTEMLNRQYTIRWEQTNWFFIRSHSNKWNVWFCAEHIVHLTVSEEKHNTCLHNILKDEVLIVVTDFIDIRKQKIIYSQFPTTVKFILRTEIVHFFLSNVGIKNLFVYSASKRRRHTSFCILNQIGLVVFVQKSLSHCDSFIHKIFLIVYSNLSHCYV